MSTVDDEFERIVGGLELDAPAERFVMRDGDVFKVSLPANARAVVAEIADAVMERASTMEAPTVYEDASDQHAFSALATDSMREQLTEACAAVRRSVWDDSVDVGALQAWIQVLNHAKFLVIGDLSAAEVARLRAAGDDRYTFVSFIGAVQHEVLQALL